MKEFEYINENNFKKLEKGLKKNNMLAFKKLNYEYYPALKNGNYIGKLVSVSNDDETYEVKLPSDKMFAQIHGKVKLIYTVFKKDQVIRLDSITPSDIWLEAFKSELTIYRGVMISKQNAAKDMFRVDLLYILKNN